MNLSLVEACLSRFIEEHEQNRYVRGLQLTKDSLEGGRLPLDEGTWSLGSWVVVGSAEGCTAVVSRQITPTHLRQLVVRLRRQGDSYVVAGWDVEDGFEEPD